MEWRSPSEIRELPPDTQVLYCRFSVFLRGSYANIGWIDDRGRIVNGRGDDFTPDDEPFYGWMPVPELLTERTE